MSNFSWDIGEIFVGDAQALGLLWLTQVRYLQFRFRKWPLIEREGPTMWELMGSAGKTASAGEISVPSRRSTMTKLVESGYARVGDLKVNLSFFFDKIAGAPFGGLPTAALKQERAKEVYVPVCNIEAAAAADDHPKPFPCVSESL